MANALRFPEPVDLNAQRAIFSLAHKKSFRAKSGSPGRTAAATTSTLRPRPLPEPSWVPGAVATIGGCEVRSPCVAVGAVLRDTVPEDAHRPDEAQRPPRGCGYIFPGQGLAPVSLTDQFARSLSRGPVASADPGNSTAASADGACGPCGGEQELSDRCERIAMLEQGMRQHDAERAAEIGRGTAFLVTGPHMEAFLPVPPPESPHESRLRLGHRLKLIHGVRPSLEEALRTRIAGAHIMGQEALPVPHKAGAMKAVIEAVTCAKSTAGGGSTPAQAATASSLQCGFRNVDELRRCSVEELLREAERHVHNSAPEDQCARVAAQLCARAYEAEPPEVLRMVRAVGAAACHASGRSASGRKELLRAADQLIQSLTLRLQIEKVEFLAEVLETMSDAGVGSQAFLDMLMALILASHHRDCQALSATVALRLASALGRVSAILQLRPRGVGGASTCTNMKVMGVVQQRIVEGIGDCDAETLARLDDYFVTRLCGTVERRTIVERMAVLEIGLRAATVHHLPLMVRLQESIQREIGESFAWSLSKQARSYLDTLKHMGLKSTAPWVQGDFAAKASWRAWRDNRGDTTRW